MSTFNLKVLDSTGQRDFSGVVSCVGEDSSGSFGILAGHARFITSLVIGLARFRSADGTWRYMAVSGGILHFEKDLLTLSTRRCLIDEDYDRISNALRQQLLTEELNLTSMKQSLHQMEEELFRRLWEMGREAA